ncbi:hypothetical protein DUNSADRAFT_16029 [Dunaliella salina]|uniref:Mediator of RNA polymerase II transcription subunit 4 n=1 Tax=Dunaliella salina TaxID=3046 RepID=A0ABQ7H1C2_DUNSA|nr:hypothetical protein DUNSADRAFT_16029 [Dunaliella salina]|eukprot:KAF5840656.1 hypothetical protein DUNSADRAFT_16029 [Dunaliella salina]
MGETEEASMLQRLEASILDLEACLDEAAEPSKRILPHNPSPESVLAYAHLIRQTTFARTTASLPPAPQQWQMAQSSLTRIAREQAASQRMLAQQQLLQAQPSRPPVVQQQAASGLPEGPAVHPDGKGRQVDGGLEQKLAEQTHEQQQPVPAPEKPVPAAAPKPVNPSAFDFILNADMEEVDEVSSSSSSDDDDDEL